MTWAQKEKLKVWATYLGIGLFILGIIWVVVKYPDEVYAVVEDMRAVRVKVVQ